MAASLLIWIVIIALSRLINAYNVSQTEISALNDLYVATNGVGWAWKYPLENFGQIWNFSTTIVDPCNGWQGVTCSYSNYNFSGTVTSLKLKQYNLRGTIPNSISNLTNLTILDMDNNFLQSTIPNSIVSISELSQLRLSYNALTGHLPLGFFMNASKLVYFSLTENHISGPLPNLEEGHSLILTQMFFNGNHLSGTIPENIGSFANLIVLFIADNLLSGTIPESVYDLVLLNRLALNGNELHGTISNKIGQMVEMRYIYLHMSNLHGTLPDTIGGMYKLVYITFFLNELTGPLTTGLCNMTRLHAIAADTNYLTGTIPECFGQLTLMEQVNLYSNYLTGTMPASLSVMSELQIMLVQDNELYGNPTLAFDRSTQLSLESVDLSSNQFSGALPVTVFGPAMKTFAAFDTCFDGAIPEEVCQATRLESLALDGMTSRCASRIWPLFPNSPKVVTEVTGSIPSCVWSELTNLTTLHLSSNSLTGTIPALASYHNLTDLDLSFNLLSGSVPATLLGWHTLMNLNLKSNCFCGTITGTQTLPFAYHDGDKGTTLTLSSNRFSGIIPLALQAAVNIDIVDGNMFSCQFGHFPPYSDPNGATYICGSNLLYVSLATLAGVLGIVGIAFLLFFRLAYRSVREHDMAAQENVSFRAVLERMREIYTNLPKITALLTLIQDSKDATLSDTDNSSARSLYYKHLVVTLISWKTQIDTLVRVEDTKHTQTMYLGKILKTSLLACEDPTLDCSCNALKATNLSRLQSANTPHLVQFLKSLHLLRRIAFMVFVAQILYTFPAYPILKYYYGTFLYQYGWYMSGAFISGVAAAIAVIVIWFLTLTIVLYVIVRFIPSRKALLYRVALQSRALELLQMYHKLEPDSQNSDGDRAAMRELAAKQVPLELPQENYTVMNIIPTLKRTMTVNRGPEDVEVARGPAIEMSSASGGKVVQPTASSLSPSSASPPRSLPLSRPRSDLSISTNMSASARSIDNDSVSSCQSGVPRRREKTVMSYLSQWFKNSVWISMMALLLNVVVVLSIKGAFVYWLNSNQTSFVLKIAIEFALSAVDLMWGVMFVPVIINRLPKMKPSGRMMLKIGLLYFNSIIAPCLAIMFTESACLQGMFIQHTSVQELFNFTYCALYNPLDFTVCQATAIWESELDYTPPFIYNFNCYSNVISAYTPIFIFSYCILALSLPLASMYITTLTKRRWFRGVVPGIFWVERRRDQSPPVNDAPIVHPMHANSDNTDTISVSTRAATPPSPSQKSAPPKKRGFRPSPFLFFPGFILASTIHHILVLLTFGLMLPELGFAVVVVVFLTTLTWEIILGRYLSRSPHCDPSKWQDPEENSNTPEVCPVSGKIIATNSPENLVKDNTTSSANAGTALRDTAEPVDCSGGLDRLCVGVSCCPRKCKALLAYGSGIVIAFAVLEMVADKYTVYESLWAPFACILLPAVLILVLKWQRVGTLDQAAYEASCAQQATTETMMLLRHTIAPTATEAGTEADDMSMALDDSRDSQDEV